MFRGDISGEAELFAIPLERAGIGGTTGREFGSLLPVRALLLGRFAYPGQFENILQKTGFRPKNDMRRMRNRCEGVVPRILKG
jgi:hypothetical protein